MSVERFLKQRAVKIVVGGTYKLDRWYDSEGKLRSFACRTTRVSPFRMMVEVPVVGKIGDRVVSYFKEFGEFSAGITDVFQGGFLMEVEMTSERRAWMADKLAWLEKKQKNGRIQDDRKDARIVPHVAHTTLALADGSIHPCFVIDVSSSGVAVSAEYQPQIGSPLAVGSCVGRVIRQFHNGFAVKFVRKQRPDDLLRLIIREDRSAERPPSLTRSGALVLGGCKG